MDHSTATDTLHIIAILFGAIAPGIIIAIAVLVASRYYRKRR
jgi:hypothetical protein